MSLIKNSVLGENVKTYPYAKVFSSTINSYTYINCHTQVHKSIIGKFCSIGSSCSIGLANHPLEFVSTSPIFYSLKKRLPITFVTKNYYSEEEEFQPITIGNDVWIGNNVIIKGNIKIGDGAIIGSGSIVTKDIPSYAIYAGIPAKLIRFRFSNEVINFLLKIQWWDREESWLKENHAIFHDINIFYSHLCNQVINEDD